MSRQLPLETLYFDANALIHARSVHSKYLADMQRLFDLAERGAIQCRTSTFTRAEMLNVAKRVAYVTQELSLGRDDLDNIWQTIRDDRIRLSAATLEDLRTDIHQWLTTAHDQSRLHVIDPDNPELMWRMAEAFLGFTSLRGTGDCIHLAHAVLLDVTVVVTEDRKLLSCYKDEIEAGGDIRDALQSALQALTGADDLPFQVMGIHDARVRVERLLEEVQASRDTNAP